MDQLQRLDLAPVPPLGPLPDGRMSRLIDVGLMHYEASLAGFAERYGRGEASHTIHVWWARRPHAAMRALVFASVSKSRSAQSLKTMDDLGRVGIGGASANALDVLRNGYDAVPKVLDMFGGGGTIPFEAASLGLEAHSLDANELSVFIQKCNLQLSQDLRSNDRAELVETTGRAVLENVRRETDAVYPARKDNVLAYLWTYRLSCQKCGYSFLLMKRPWLTKKKGKNLALLLQSQGNQEGVKIAFAASDLPRETNWVGRNGIARCPKCTTEHSSIDIRQCEDALLVAIKKAQPTGKDFLLSDSRREFDKDSVSRFETQLVKELKVSLPNSEPPRWSGIVNPPLYGMVTHADCLNQRQRVVLLVLIKELRAAYYELKKTRGENTARFVVAALSGLIDQLVDWNCRLSTWISQNEQVGRAFCGPGVAMYWDYCEIDPLLKGPANLWDKLDRIVAGVSSIPTFPVKPFVQQGYAQSLPYESETFDAVVCDPPYYDNIFYSALADFFYAWKRLLFVDIDPNSLHPECTDTKRELVASTFRAGSPQKAHDSYCVQFSAAIAEAARVMKPDAVFSLVYSHSSIAGWDAIVKSYRAAPLVISSVQPLSIERKQRPRAVFSDAVNTCVVFVARKNTETKNIAVASDLIDEMRAMTSGKFVDSLEASGWNERDIGVAVFAQGVALLANCRATDIDDRSLLRQFAEVVSGRFPSFEIVDRKSL